MRKKKNLIPRMERCAEWQVADPYAHKGQWRELMPGCREVRVELGCGKGRFTVESAASEPDVLFLAVEKVPDALVVAMERAREANVRNVFFMVTDADQLTEQFAPGEIDCLYINFCDPWPPKRQAKRRLTHVNFLRLYQQVLRPDGEIRFKTDNAPLFAFSLEEFTRCGFSLHDVTDDLHADGPCGVMTDYEKKFYGEGIPIHRLVAVPPAEKISE